MSELFPRVIETERLRMEPRTPEYVDVFEVYDICSSGEIEEVTRYVPWDAHPHPKETMEFLERGAKGREEGKTAAYVVRPREGEDGAGDVAGFAGLMVEWDRRSCEPGIWLRKPFWGRGYSGERAMALAELAFDVLDLEVLTVPHHVDNEKSGRAIEKYMERMGGECDGVFRNAMVMNGEPVDERRFSVTQAQWREATDDGAAGPDVRFEF